MKLATSIIAAFALPASLLALQQFRDTPKPFREYPGWEYENFPLPPDFADRSEWAFARLMYPPARPLGLPLRPDWTQGGSNWTMDYPRSDRHFVTGPPPPHAPARALRRAACQPRRRRRRLQLAVALRGRSRPWELTDDQAKKLREYLLRGGFFMCDDFHGTMEWEIFAAACGGSSPTAPSSKSRTTTPIFHTVYDLDDRYQVPGAQFLRSGRTYEQDGYEARTGAASTTTRAASWSPSATTWIWAIPGNGPTIPRYPEKFSALGLRIGVNYVIYAMTH